MRKVFLAALLIVPLGQSAVWAHGDISSSIPAADATVKKPPNHIIINFTEPPAKSSVVEVRDGCGTEITSNVEFDEMTGHVFMDEGQPGKWKVSYKVLSAADGHKTSGGYGLTVDGKKDCSADEPKGNGGKNGNGDSGPGPQAGGDAGDDEGSFPVVPIAIGSVGVIGLALVARRFAS